MGTQHVTPRPGYIRFHDPEQMTDVRRGIGSKITCPTCGRSKRARSWAELRGWLREHTAQEHGG